MMGSGGTDNLSPTSLLRLSWLLFCLVLMCWQTIRCTQEFMDVPVVSKVSYQRFSDEFLPSITVCPKVGSGLGLFKVKELIKHGLNQTTYFIDKDNFTWRSKRNSSMTAEDLLSEVTWQVEDLVASLEWEEVGAGWQILNIADMGHLWTLASRGPFHYGCYKLDLGKIKNSTARLSQVVVNSRFPAGIHLLLHKVDQAFDSNLGVSIDILADLKYIARGIKSHTSVQVSLKVIRALSTSQEPCNLGAFDSSLVDVATQRMMAAAGCVVPWVDRREGAPICHRVLQKLQSTSSIYRLHNI